jgi:chemotaxis protein CheC
MSQTDDLLIDALGEISNVAMGHLSQIISQLTKKEMSISVPNSNILSIRDAINSLEAIDTEVFVGYTNVIGDVEGSLTFLLQKEDSMKLTELILNERTNQSLFPNSFEREALYDLMAITGSGYLNAITQFLGFYLLPKSPVTKLIKAGELLEFLEDAPDYSEEYETEALIGVSINYKVEQTNVKGEFLLLLGPNLLKLLRDNITG